jgi:hypothetical protein
MKQHDNTVLQVLIVRVGHVSTGAWGVNFLMQVCYCQGEFVNTI